MQSNSIKPCYDSGASTIAHCLLTKSVSEPGQTSNSNSNSKPASKIQAALEFILEALGYYPALVYEKRRETWRLGETEIVVDELPFGLFMEIEGAEKSIKELKTGLRSSGSLPNR